MMGTKNFNALFYEIKQSKDVKFPTYSNESGHVILGGIVMGCIFTIVADAREAASLSVSGKNAEPIISGLQRLITEIVGTEPLCRYDVHSNPELHVIEWCMGMHDTVYLIDLVSGGGRYFRLQPKENLVLFNGHNPQEYYSADYAAELQAEYQQYCHDNWCRLNQVEDTTPKTGQPYIKDIDLSLTQYANAAH